MIIFGNKKHFRIFFLIFFFFQIRINHSWQRGSRSGRSPGSRGWARSRSCSVRLAAPGRPWVLSRGGSGAAAARMNHGTFPNPCRAWKSGHGRQDWQTHTGSGMCPPVRIPARPGALGTPCGGHGQQGCSRARAAAAAGTARC